MASLFKDLGDESFPGHLLKVYEDEYGHFHLTCNLCEGWEAVEVSEDDVPQSWYLKHYVWAFFHEDPLAFLK